MQRIDSLHIHRPDGYAIAAVALPEDVIVPLTVEVIGGHTLVTPSTLPRAEFTGVVNNALVIATDQWWN